MKRTSSIVRFVHKNIVSKGKTSRFKKISTPTGSIFSLAVSCILIQRFSGFFFSINCRLADCCHYTACQCNIAGYGDHRGGQSNRRCQIPNGSEGANFLLLIRINNLSVLSRLSQNGTTSFFLL